MEEVNEEELVASLTREIVSGRKLWVALHGPALEIPGFAVVPDPHCTVLHMGRPPRGVDARSWAAVGVEIARLAERRLPSLRCRGGGLARFSSGGPGGSPVVALVQEPMIRTLRRDVVDTAGAALGTATRAIEGDFDFTPHVTVSRVLYSESVSLPHWEGPISLTHAGVTCGDAHARWPLRGTRTTRPAAEALR